MARGWTGWGVYATAVIVLMAAAGGRAGAQTPEDAPAPPASAKPATVGKDKPAAKAKERPAKETKGKDKPAAAEPKPAEPKSVTVRSLPGPIVKLHNCAPVTSKVELLQERFGKSVLFFVTCPAAERGGYQLQVVYVARDAKGTGARRVTFETPDADGTMVTRDALPSAIPARETFVEKVEERDVVRARQDPPWITGAWRPDNREGVCAVVGHWRVEDAKAELWLWEEAKECPKDAAPKYEAKIDKKPPPLVAR